MRLNTGWRVMTSGLLLATAAGGLQAAAPPLYLSEFRSDGFVLPDIGSFVTNMVQLRLNSVREVRLDSGKAPDCQPNAQNRNSDAVQTRAASSAVFFTVAGSIEGSRGLGGRTASLQWEVTKSSGCTTELLQRRNKTVDEESALRTFTAMADDIAEAVTDAASMRARVFLKTPGSRPASLPKQAQQLVDYLDVALDISDTLRPAENAAKADYDVTASWVESRKGNQRQLALQLEIQPQPKGRASSRISFPIPASGSKSSDLSMASLARQVIDRLGTEHLRFSAGLSDGYDKVPPRELLDRASAAYCLSQPPGCDPNPAMVVALLAGRAAEIEPKADTYELLGKAYTDLDRDLDARDSYTAAAKATANTDAALEYWRKAADAGMAGGDSKGSLEIFQSVLAQESALKKVRADTYLGLSRLQQELGKEADAIRTLIQARLTLPDAKEISESLTEKLRSTPDDVAERQKICGELRAQLPTEPALASCLFSVALSLHNNSKVQEALPLYTEAVAVLDANPEDQRERLPDMLLSYANAYSYVRNYDQALEVNQRNLNLRKVKFGDGSKEYAAALAQRGLLHNHAQDYVAAINELKQAMAIDHETQDEHAYGVAARDLGSILSIGGRLSEAEVLQREALTILEKQGASWEIADALSELGSTLEEEGHLEEAEANERRAVSLVEGISTARGDLATNLQRLARTLSEEGKFKEAIETQTKALTLRTTLYGDNSTDVATSVFETGVTYLYWGKYGQAERVLRDALARAVKEYGEDHQQTGVFRNSLGLWAEYTGHYKDSEDLRQVSGKTAERLFGRDSIYYAEDHARLAGSYTLTGRYRQADQALDADMPYLVNHEELPYTIALANRAKTRMGQGKLDEALEMARQALALREKHSAESEWRLSAYLVVTGRILTAMGRHEEAAMYYNRTLDIWKRLGFPDHPDTAAALTGLGLLAGSKGDYSRMNQNCTDALKIATQNLSPNHPDAAAAQECLSQYQEQGAKNLERALTSESSAITILRNAFKEYPNHPAIAQALAQRAKLYDRLNRAGDAARDREEQQKILREHAAQEARVN